MRRIAITNEKGGSVKTTTATSLAAALAERGHRVLLLNLDGQGNATSWLGAEPAGELVDALLGGAPLATVVRPTSWAGVDAIAATSRLKAAEKLLGTEPGGERLLGTAIAALPDRWDYLLWTVRPRSGCRSPLTAADELLVPVEATYLALEGLAALTGTLEKVRWRLNGELRFTGILLCRTDPRVIARPVPPTSSSDSSASASTATPCTP